MGQLLDALGENLSEQEVDAMVATVDKDGSGEIEFNEFLTMMQNKISGMDTLRDLRQAFELLDKDGRGFIASNELKHVVTDFCGKLNDHHVNQVLVQHNLEPDGQISFEQFHRLMTFAEDEAEAEADPVDKSAMTVE